MLEDKHVAVVIPAYNEEELIEATLQGIPKFVDRVYVVDDASRDGTVGRAHSAGAVDARIVVIVHERNAGVGAAVVTGYTRAVADRMDVVCVMNADNQMDPKELEHLAAPVARGDVDYAKANRLFTGEAWEIIPHHRYLGNAVLSLLTKIASGYWHVADAQAGYTAIGLPMLELMKLENIYPRYGYPNDLLVHLNVWNARVRDVPSRPIYGIGERSDIRLRKVVPTISWLLFRRFWWRMGQKYVIRDFHPLVFFYIFGLLMSAAGLALGIAQAVLRYGFGVAATAGTVVLIALFLMFGLLFTLFAMWFDMETNKELR
jgi:glycosyltransferase involved in cell wall biosynthesis